MKILLVRNADTKNFGGAETFVLEIATQLQKLKHEVVVATALPRLRKKLDQNGIKNEGAPWLPWTKWHGIYTLLLPIHGIWICWLVFIHFIKITNHQPDILHVMNRDDFIAGTIAGMLTRTPVIWTDHADLKHEFSNIKNPFKNMLGKVLLFWAKQADAITVVSNSEKKLIKQNVGNKLDDKITVIYNGTTKPKKLNKIIKPKNTLVLGLATRVRNQKGLRELIDSFGQLTPPKAKKLELWIIGDGPDEDSLKQRAESHPEIKFLGFKEDWLEYVNALDIFVFPTYTEGFSLSLLEAAMLEKPIIATSVGGNPEIINSKTGILIPPKDVPALSEALQELINNPELGKKLGKAANKTWEENFDFKSIVENDFINLYNKVV
jgi:glycosyltransferase involved in cell wall biosynthesis